MGLARRRSIVLAACVTLAACPASWRGAAVLRPSASISVDIERMGDELVIDYEIINRGHDPIYAFVHPPRPDGSTTPLGHSAYVYFSRSREVTIGLAPQLFQTQQLNAVLVGRRIAPVYSGAARIGPQSNYHSVVRVPLPLAYRPKYEGESAQNEPPPTAPTTITKLTFEVAYLDWRDVDVIDSYVEQGDVYFHTLPDIRIRGPLDDPSRQTTNLRYAIRTASVRLPAKLPPERLRTSPPRPPPSYGVH